MITCKYCFDRVYGWNYLCGDGDNEGDDDDVDTNDGSGLSSPLFPVSVWLGYGGKISEFKHITVYFVRRIRSQGR